MEHLAFKMALSLTTALSVVVGGGVGLTTQAQAQSIFERQDTLEPVQSYTVEMTAGEFVAIAMTSDDFDPWLRLLGPNGEEVAFNDDFGGTLNARIVYNVPTSGEYTIIAKSFDEQGGVYDLQVRAAETYEVAFYEAQIHAQEGDYEAAIADYSEVISLEPDIPEAYLGRADAYFGQAQAQLQAQGLVLGSPDDLAPATRDAIIADFEQAATLYEAAGDSFTAQSIREQVQQLQPGGFTGPDGGGER
ncbi:MAG: tetratricopeptide repeat protein [Cyanobacteria bacterium J06638_28]